MTRDKVLSWCREQRLFAPGDRVTAALSGGADSVAMLHLLLSLQQELGISVAAAHFNHRLRGPEADRDEDFCRRLCRRLGVPLQVGAADVARLAAERGCGVETAAREARYAFLSGCGGVAATAHTADDNLETVLLHLTRGAALRGLSGIPPKRRGVVRPILCLTRDEVEAYLAAHRLPHVEDATNGADLCSRNRLRRRVTPLLRQENPSVARAVLQAGLTLREDEAYLEAQARALLEQARRPGGWSAPVLAGAPRPLRLRALRLLLEPTANLTARHLAAAEALLAAGPSARIVLPGRVLRRQYELLRIGPPPSGGLDPFPLPVPGSRALPDGRTLRCTGPFSYGGEPGLCLRLPASYQVRERRSGDRLRLSGGSKPVKAWMIDRKIPAALRDGVPVFVCGGAVAAVWRVGVDPAFRPAPGEPCCRIDILDREVESYDPSL